MALTTTTAPPVIPALPKLTAAPERKPEPVIVTVRAETPWPTAVAELTVGAERLVRAKPAVPVTPATEAVTV